MILSRKQPISSFTQASLPSLEDKLHLTPIGVNIVLTPIGVFI